MDTDYALKASDRSSVSGGIVLCAGAWVEFCSRTQNFITLSFAEVEHVAMAAGFSETIFMRNHWSFLFPNRDIECTTVMEDNRGAVHLANNPVTSPNCKHIDVRDHFIRERVAKGESAEQHAVAFSPTVAHGGISFSSQHSNETCVVITFSSSGVGWLERRSAMSPSTPWTIPNSVVYCVYS